MNQMLFRAVHYFLDQEKQQRVDIIVSPDGDSDDIQDYLQNQNNYLNERRTKMQQGQQRSPSLFVDREETIYLALMNEIDPSVSNQVFDEINSILEISKENLDLEQQKLDISMVLIKWNLSNRVIATDMTNAISRSFEQYWKYVAVSSVITFFTGLSLYVSA